MQPYIDAFRTFLNDQKPQFGCSELDSLLGILYCCYSQNNRLETDALREKFKAVNHILEKLEIRESDRLFCLTLQIGEEYQRKAFFEGILIGFRLYEEILGSSHSKN